MLILLQSRERGLGDAAEGGLQEGVYGFLIRGGEVSSPAAHRAIVHDGFVAGPDWVAVRKIEGLDHPLNGRSIPNERFVPDHGDVIVGLRGEVVETPVYAGFPLTSTHGKQGIFAYVLPDSFVSGAPVLHVSVGQESCPEVAEVP